MFESQSLGKEGDWYMLVGKLKGSTELGESDEGDLNPSNIRLSRKSLSHFGELQTDLFSLRRWTDQNPVNQRTSTSCLLLGAEAAGDSKTVKL